MFVIAATELQSAPEHSKTKSPTPDAVVSDVTVTVPTPVMLMVVSDE